MRLLRRHAGPRRSRHAAVGTALVLAAVSLAALTSSSAAAPADVPKNVGEPAISGTPLLGHRLTTTTGTWSGSPTSFAYRWVRCGADGGLPDGSNCAPIAGADRRGYTLRDADLGFRLRVRVTATNGSGSATAASNPTVTITSAGPRNTVLPTISGSAVAASTLQASQGTWTGQSPITFRYQWLRCDTSGGRCDEIGGAASSTYQVRDGDVGRTLRVRVTARNDVGSRSAISAQTSVVQAKPGPVGVITLPSGERSIPVTSIPSSERLIVSQVVFSPVPVRSRQDPITVRVRVKDTRGFVVRDALVFVRATPRVTSSGDRQPTAVDGWVTYQLVPNANFPQPRSGYNVQFFVKAYRAGDPVLAGVAAYRLVQVRLAG